MCRFRKERNNWNKRVQKRHNCVKWFPSPDPTRSRHNCHHRPSTVLSTSPRTAPTLDSKSTTALETPAHTAHDAHHYNMATPSSSATSSSASPPMSYMQAAITVTPVVGSSVNMDPVEREERKKAVQKFLARAEISMVSQSFLRVLIGCSDTPEGRVTLAPLHSLTANGAYLHICALGHVPDGPDY